ncbi:MAG: PKD domain-containing protein, partial [Methanoregula sp.]
MKYYSAHVSGSPSAGMNRPSTTASRGGGKFVAGGWHRMLLIGLLVAVVMIAGPVSAATITVTEDGSEGYSTLSAAVSAAGDGDIIYIKAGTYTDSSAIYISQPNIHIKGEDIDKVFLNPAPDLIEIQKSGCSLENLNLWGNNNGYISLLATADSTIIRNITFDSPGASGAITIASSNNLIANNVILNAKRNRDSLAFTQAGSFNQVHDNVISGATSDYSRGVYLNFQDSTIFENNTIRDGNYYGLYINGTNNTIRNNAIIGNTQQGLYFYKTDLNNSVYLNTITGNGGTVKKSTTATAPTWVSPNAIDYSFNGVSNSGITGNYWGSSYSDPDADNNGIGDTPFTPLASFGTDTAPLMGVWRDGQILGGPDTIAPGAGFTMDHASGQAPFTVQFREYSPGPGTVSSYAWDFDNDGTIDSTDKNPSNTYTKGGVYTVNLTVTGPGGSTSVVKSDLITIKVAGIDLVVSAVSSLIPHSSNTVTATIKNVGTVDAGAFKASFTLDGSTTNFDIPSLAAGKSTFISVTDPVTTRKYGDSIPLTITLDTENSVSESDETNNEYTKPATVTTGGGLYDYYVGGRYYTGNDIETSVYKEGHIGVVYSTAGIGYGGAGTVTYTPTDLPVPATAKILSARLYQSWTWWGYGAGDTVQFNGHESQGPEALFFEPVNGKNGQAVFNVTDYFVPGSDNTAVITATSSANYAPLLVVVYEDESEPWRQIWVDEGSDTLYSADVVSTDPYIAYAMFSNVTTTDLFSAQMTAFLPSGGDRNVNSVIFNGQSVPVNSIGGTDPTFKYVNVTDTLKTGTNELGVRMFEAGDYLNLAVAVLEVTKETASEADFTAIPTTGPAPLTVHFTDTSTGTPASWAWDFGDGDATNATEQNPVHTYTTSGIYTVNLTVTNSVGSNTTTKNNFITASSSIPAPVANFTAEPTTGTAPLTVTFTDASTNTPTGWQWDFNNDGTIDSTEKNPVHTYTNAGTYTVNLTATNAYGSTSMVKTGYITVTGGSGGSTGPVVSFSADTTSGNFPLTVQFTDGSTGNVTAWAWDFTNDGVVDSTVQNPAYNYTNAGKYSVNLTATNAEGTNSTVKSGYITVNIVSAASLPLTTEQTGTVSGDLYVGSFQPVPFGNQPQTGVTSR